MDPIAAEWKAKLMETIKPHVNLPIMLSGGVDSGTLLAALLEYGSKPDCYGFRVGTYENPDVACARKMCRDHGLQYTVIDIPSDYDSLVRDLYEVIGLLRRSRKAMVQCSQPIKWMARRIAADGYSEAIVGTGAVVLDDRTVMVLKAEKGEEAAREYRREKLEDRYRECGTGMMHHMARLCGVTLQEPYSDEPLKSYALALDIDELNRPKQKGIALRAFPEFWAKGYYRRNSPLQVASGVREWHDRVLLPSQANRRGSKAVVGIYNDILREIASGQ